MGMGLEWRWDREPLCWHTGLEVRTGSITSSAPTWEPGRRGEPPPPHRWHRDGGTVTPPGCRAALSAATASAAALHEAPLPAPTAAGGGREAERGHARSTAQTCSQEGLLPTAPARRGSASATRWGSPGCSGGHRARDSCGDTNRTGSCTAHRAKAASKHRSLEQEGFIATSTRSQLGGGTQWDTRGPGRKQCKFIKAFICSWYDQEWDSDLLYNLIQLSGTKECVLNKKPEWNSKNIKRLSKKS